MVGKIMTLYIDKKLAKELQDRAFKIMAEQNKHCSINDVIRMLLKAWDVNPLLAAQVKTWYFAMSSH